MCTPVVSYVNLLYPDRPLSRAVAHYQMTASVVQRQPGRRLERPDDGA